MHVWVLRTGFGLSCVTAHVIFVQSSTSTCWQNFSSLIWINRKLWITVTGWMATWSFLTAKYFQPWLSYASWHHLLNRHGVFLRLGWYLLCCVLVIKVCFTDFDDRDLSIGVYLRGPQTLNIPSYDPPPKSVKQILWLPKHNTVDTCNSQNANGHHACLALNFTCQYQGWKYFPVGWDQDITCCHLACNNDAQISVDMYRGGVMLSPGTGSRYCKK